MSFLYNNVPIMPGAYLVNSLPGINNALHQLPIFGSVSKLIKMGYERVDNMYYVMPGYKIELYRNQDYITNGPTINNTTGTKIMYVTIAPPDDCASIKMFYKDVEIADKYTYTVYGNNAGSLTTTPTTTLTSGSHKLLDLSLFPGAYMINAVGIGCMPIFFSITDLSTFSASAGDREDSVLVMPGYKIILYFNTGYNNPTAGNHVAIDNTTGTTIIVGESGYSGAGGWTSNSISSCRLYFNGNEVTQASIADITTS